MRDIDLTYRDIGGVVTFGFKPNSYNTDIEVIIQKVVASILSYSKTTYFGNVQGSNALVAGKFNFTDNGSQEFRIAIAADILNIKKQIQADDVKYNVASIDRLRDLQIQDVVYDVVNQGVYLSLLVSTNSTSQVIKLPVKS